MREFIEVIEETGVGPDLFLENKDPLVPKDLGYLAVRIEDIAELAAAGRARLEARGHPPFSRPLQAERALLHDAAAAGPVGEIRHVRVDFARRDPGIGPIEPPRPVGTCRLTVPASDAPVIVDDGDAIGFLPSRFDGTHFRAGRIRALVTLNGHVEVTGLGRFRVVVLIASFQIKGADGDFQHSNVLDLRAATLVVLLHAGMHTLTATNAAGKIQRIHELNFRNRLRVTDYGLDAVLPIDLGFDVGKEFGLVLRGEFLVVLAEEVFACKDLVGVEIG